jgi:hypothetical protein
MKGSVISAITFAIAVAAVPSRGPKDKGSDIASNQCQSGSLQCCANADQVEYGGLFHFLDGFNLLNVEAACSPINVVGDITLNILGKLSEYLTRVRIALTRMKRPG